MTFINMDGCGPEFVSQSVTEAREKPGGRRLRLPPEFGQFPSRFRQFDGRGRPSHIVARVRV